MEKRWKHAFEVVTQKQTLKELIILKLEFTGADVLFFQKTYSTQKQITEDIWEQKLHVSFSKSKQKMFSWKYRV